MNKLVEYRRQLLGLPSAILSAAKASSIDSDWSIKNKKTTRVLTTVSAWYAMVSSTFRIMISLFDHDVAPRVSQKKTDAVPGGTRWDRGARPCGFLQCRELVSQPKPLALRGRWTSIGRSLQIEARDHWV